MIYGYVRVSTKKQSEQRQIDNIKRDYPTATIMIEKYTGTTMDRPVWKRLCHKLKPSDTIVFDEVSRMARNAEEGFKVYRELYESNVNLVFLKEATINTDSFRNVQQVEMTGTDLDILLAAVNRYIKVIQENQIKAAFKTAEHEADFNHMRTAEAVRSAQLQGKQVGRKEGTIVETEKEKRWKAYIRELSKDFEGEYNDTKLIEITGLSRNTIKKYKSKLRGENVG